MGKLRVDGAEGDGELWPFAGALQARHLKGDLSASCWVSDANPAGLIAIPSSVGRCLLMPRIVFVTGLSFAP
ncbi:hypothetical protein DPEC_G00306120 [Dallia pectoralis]|uniref:Uncharacterized protein n=1 Tax=Dallia pectoralis TaxID=75939 RepID=A0ACC2FE04_DALPE|nr:hypothetical protein DPEC_G00306120 [Dallia pectoralis]